MTTTALPDTRTDLEVIEALDFEHTPGCEHPAHPSGGWGHAGPAFALVRVSRPCGCAPTHDRYVCRGSWDFAFKTGFQCVLCGLRGPRDMFWTLISLVNGA